MMKTRIINLFLLVDQEDITLPLPGTVLQQTEPLPSSAPDGPPGEHARPAASTENPGKFYDARCSVGTRQLS